MEKMKQEKVLYKICKNMALWFFKLSWKNIIYNERLKYTPLNGEKINGALTFEIDKREYTIIRSFGKTKKMMKSKS